MDCIVRSLTCLKAFSVKRRQQVPGPVRPARPERWLAAAWLSGNTCSASMPILGLYTCTASVVDNGLLLQCVPLTSCHSSRWVQRSWPSDEVPWHTCAAPHKSALHAVGHRLYATHARRRCAVQD